MRGLQGRTGYRTACAKNVAVLQDLGHHQQYVSHVVVRIEKSIAMRWPLRVTSLDTCLGTWRLECVSPTICLKTAGYCIQIAWFVSREEMEFLAVFAPWAERPQMSGSFIWFVLSWSSVSMSFWVWNSRIYVVVQLSYREGEMYNIYFLLGFLFRFLSEDLDDLIWLQIEWNWNKRSMCCLIYKTCQITAKCTGRSR